MEQRRTRSWSSSSKMQAPTCPTREIRQGRLTEPYSTPDLLHRRAKKKRPITDPDSSATGGARASSEMMDGLKYRTGHGGSTTTATAIYTTQRLRGRCSPRPTTGGQAEGARTSRSTRSMLFPSWSNDQKLAHRRQVVGHGRAGARQRSPFREPAKENGTRLFHAHRTQGAPVTARSAQLAHRPAAPQGDRDAQGRTGCKGQATTSSRIQIASKSQRESAACCSSSA